MAYKQRWIEYFVVLDANKSGFIDPGDLEFIQPALAKLFNKPEDSKDVQDGAKAMSNFFHGIVKNFDTDKDGKVSKEELLAGVEKNFIGKPIDALPAWWKESIAVLFHSALNRPMTVEDFQFLKNFHPSITDEELKQAWEWGVKRTGHDKFDHDALSESFYVWATSPEPFPEGRAILPFFYAK